MAAAIRQAGGTVGRARHGDGADEVVTFAAALYSRREQLAQQITIAIGEQDPIGRSAAVHRAAVRAIDDFLARLFDPSAPRDQLDDRFRRLGRAQAHAGVSLESLRSGYQVATSIAWRSIWSAAQEVRLPAAAAAERAAAAFSYLDSLCEQSVLGYHEHAESSSRWQERLLDTILHPEHHPAWRLGQLAGAGNWPVPQRVVAVAVQRSPDAPLPATGGLPAGTLADLRRRPALLLCRAPLTAEVRAELATVFAEHTVAIGCPVRLVEAATSLRWAERCLELAGTGIVQHRPVLDCAEHMAVLWLHAEPLLRRQLGQQVLAPLLREAPHSRRILAETMLAWLETRGSAPALAARLGKHAQTVRYRMRRLQEIFGPVLEDPERCFEIYLVLRAGMPLWRAGQFAEEMQPPSLQASRTNRMS
jgi:PucR C-terminal helix-turn-helix domain